MIKMPLKPKYQKIYNNMVKEYGPKKGRQIFYASANKHGWKYDYKSKTHLEIKKAYPGMPSNVTRIIAEEDVKRYKNKKRQWKY